MVSLWLLSRQVLKFDVNMMEFVDPSADIHFTRDMHEQGLNSGVFFVKVCVCVCVWAKVQDLFTSCEANG
jgi:hypothetical protein